MAISASVRSISLKLPPNLTLIPKSSIPQNHPFLSSSRPISIQRLPTKPSSSSSSSSSSPSSQSSLSSVQPQPQPVEELPPKLQEIVNLFQSVREPKAKYEQLLFYARNLPPLDPGFKTPQNRVQGCVSQVWVRASFLDPPEARLVRFEADSDSALTKGLAALLVLGLSGCPVQDILRVSPDFALLLGLRQSLTPSRNNGFVNILKLMQKKALLLYAQAAEQAAGGGGTVHCASDNGSHTDDDVAVAEAIPSSHLNSGDAKKIKEEEEDEASPEQPGGGSDSVSPLGMRGERIREKLERELKPTELAVEDTSYQHAGHAGVKGSDGETHFNVKVVSGEFEGKSLVKRHRLVYDLLHEELQSGLHALSIIAKTPSEASNR